LRPLVEADHPGLSVRRQCELLGLSRSSLYYQPAAETAENVRLMWLLDQEYTAHPFLGSRRVTRWLREQGEQVNRKRVQRLLRVMGLEATYPKPRASVPGPGHRVYPYLLRGVEVTRPDQVWSADITYLPMARGFMYLAATIDWYSRYVVAWRLSNTLDGSFCLDMLEEALGRGRPEVFNTDQGVQFTAAAWTGKLEAAGVQVSMDGKGRSRAPHSRQDKMRYDEYRKQGLPLMSSHVESTIKQMNYRVKGTEKFWSDAGAEAVLQLRADYLSDDEPLEGFWQRRQAAATGQRRYRHSA
jgi:putative transposase